MSVWRRDDGRTEDGGPLVVGHRGGRGEGWPLENSLAAFAEAKREGARAIELDARPSRGGVPVVHHDETLVRTTGGRDVRAVADVAEEELGTLGIPTLQAALDWATREGVAVNVEIKRDAPHRVAHARRIGAMLRTTKADVIVSSFDPLLLLACGPPCPLAWLVADRHAAWAFGASRIVRRALYAIHLEDAAVTEPRVASLRSRGYAVGVYTVNDPGRARALAAMRVDWIFTDRPGLLIGELSAGRPPPPSARI